LVEIALWKAGLGCPESQRKRGWRSREERRKGGRRREERPRRRKSQTGTKKKRKRKKKEMINQLDQEEGGWANSLVSVLAGTVLLFKVLSLFFKVAIEKF
jgi:hypothetical protein